MILPVGGAPPSQAPITPDEMPQVIGSIPVSAVGELGRHLCHRALTDDFWIPLPTRPALAQFLLQEPTRLDLRPTSDRRFSPEQHMGGLVYGIRLRQYMVEELHAMSHESTWRLKLGMDHVHWHVRCQMATELLRRDIRDLTNRHVFHSYDAGEKCHDACLCREVERGWDWACEAAARRLGGTADAGACDAVAQ